MRMKFGAFRGFTVGAGLLIFPIVTVRAAVPHQEKLSCPVKDMMLKNSRNAVHTKK